MKITINIKKTDAEHLISCSSEWDSCETVAATIRLVKEEIKKNKRFKK